MRYIVRKVVQSDEITMEKMGVAFNLLILKSSLKTLFCRLYDFFYNALAM